MEKSYKLKAWNLGRGKEHFFVYLFTFFSLLLKISDLCNCIKRADEARVESLEALERLAAVKSERLRLTFHTSSANFTSAEALQFLDGFNTSDEVTLMGRMIFKNTITHDIEAFSHAEAEFEEKMKEKKEMDQEVKKKGKDLEKAVNSLRDAEQVSGFWSNLCLLVLHIKYDP